MPVNATLESAELMMSVIRDLGVAKTVGFKPAGGVRTAEDALHYLQLADRILGEGWADARHFRFGASSLLASLLTALGHQTQTAGGAADRFRWRAPGAPVCTDSRRHRGYLVPGSRNYS